MGNAKELIIAVRDIDIKQMLINHPAGVEVDGTLYDTVESFDAESNDNNELYVLTALGLLMTKCLNSAVELLN
jgi:hypothetical protein